MQKSDRESSAATMSARKLRSIVLRRFILIGLLLTLALLLLATLFRVSLAEYAARRFCNMHEIRCQIDISAMTPSRLMIRKLAIEDEKSRKLLSMDAADITVSWPRLFKPQAEQVMAQGVDLRLDLTGEGHPLGRLAELVPPQTAGQGVLPHIVLEDAGLSLLTPAGVIDVMMQIDIRSLNEARAEFQASPASLMMGENRLELAAAQGHIEISGNVATGDGRLRLEELVTSQLSASDADLDFSFNRAAGPLKVQASGKAAYIGREDLSLEAVVLDLAAELDRPGFPAFSDRNLLGTIRMLTVKGTSGQGRSGQSGWRSADLSLDVSAGDDKMASGPMKLTLLNARLDGRAETETISVSTDVTLPRGRRDPLVLADNGRLEVVGLSASPEGLAAELMGWMKERSPSPVRSSLGEMADVLSAALQGFDASASFNGAIMPDRSLRMSALESVRAAAPNGVIVELSPEVPAQPIFIWSGDKRLISGQLDVRAGPFDARLNDMRLELTGNMSVTGDLGLRLRDDISDLQMDLDTISFVGGDSAELEIAEFQLAFSGAAYSAQWQNVSARGRLTARQIAQEWRVMAPDGLVVSLDEMETRLTRLSGFSTLFQPDGALLETGVNGASGRGSLGQVSTQLSIKERQYQLKFGKADIDWRAGSDPVANFGFQDVGLGFSLSGKPLSLRAPSAKARLVADDRWRVDGSVQNAAGQIEPALIQNLSTDFAFRGASEGVIGKIDALKFRIRDIQTPGRFAAMDFAGQLDLNDGDVTGGGTMTHPLLQQQMARLTISHDLSTGEGDARITSTILQFSRGGL